MHSSINIRSAVSCGISFVLCMSGSSFSSVAHKESYTAKYKLLKSYCDFIGPQKDCNILKASKALSGLCILAFGQRNSNLNKI